MTWLNAIVTPLAAAVLLVVACGFAPWPDNMLGDAALLGIPVWLGVGALALGRSRWR